ncbi:MAG TPA: OmpA family protein [Vicinamibacterales bacterium]|nr:OmpA family protein [Vicinamibacterales bacterium]
MMRAAGLAAIVLASTIAVYAQSVTADRDWKAQGAVLTGTREADVIVRVGDVDNLGFGWPAEFDPFCGRMTQTHEYPFAPQANDLPGFDRMLVSSKFSPASGAKCGGDGYSRSETPRPASPVVYSLPTDAAKGTTVQSAHVQLFIDDFQAPVFCSKFEVSINNTRFIEAERVLNAIEQTGPVGKLVTLKLPEEFHAAIAAGGALQLKIDDANGAADGFAIDFVRLLVNRRRESTCAGDVTGVVQDKDTGAPIAGARVQASDLPSVMTDKDGRFLLRGVTTGYETVAASAAGYNDGSRVADVAQGSDNAPVTITLEKGRGSAAFAGKTITAGETINLNNILFDQGKAELRPESRAELDRIAAFMKANPLAEIELSGHTSSEGEAAMNRSLSYQRVKACKDYVVAAGINLERILVVGYGPDRPVAPNDTEAGRARNRRVEMRVLKLN